MSAIGRADLEQRLTLTEIDRNLWAARWRKASGEREALRVAGDAVAEAARRLLRGDRSPHAWTTLDGALSRWSHASSRRRGAGAEGAQAA
jgi:hypothetical protein